MPKKFTRRSKDVYRDLAREAGYYSRAAFKLTHIDERHQIFTKTRSVLDLGAAPGGWSQVALERVSDSTKVIGVDIVRIKKIEDSRFLPIRADIRSLEWRNMPEVIASSPFDLILSDLSPKITGVWDRDHALQIELAEMAMEVALEMGHNRTVFVCKVFQGSMSNHFARDARQIFESVQFFKPRASRSQAAETYLIGKHLL